MPRGKAGDPLWPPRSTVCRQTASLLETRNVYKATQRTTGAFYLDEVNRYPLMPPKVDSATEMGITQENMPSSFSPNVCNKKTDVVIWKMPDYTCTD